MGTSLEECLMEECDTLGQKDFSIFASAILINRRFGGNVTKVLESISSMMRERLNARRKFRALVAQTEFSKKILLALPVLMYAVLSVMNPEYMSVFRTDTIGLVMFGAAWALLTLGWLVMGRMNDATGETA